jgi:hypothetical protein
MIGNKGQKNKDGDGTDGHIVADQGDQGLDPKSDQADPPIRSQQHSEQGGHPLAASKPHKKWVDMSPDGENAGQQGYRRLTGTIVADQRHRQKTFGHIDNK